jgi:3-phenylpropionate/trans-cinnamate dioxygenase ferredoxin reductase subunit
MRRLVVVGAGLAGHRAVQAARRAGFDGELWMVGDEVHEPYDRPPLSKQLLAGRIEQTDTFYKCDGLDIKWVLGHAATGLDLERGVVELADHEDLSYDALVLATGRRAREWPDLPELEGFHMLRSLDDSKALREAVKPSSRVAIVGAGFIGCEVAATLRGLGVEEVTLIDVADHPMPVLGPEIGRRASALHERHGVKLRLGTSVAEFEGSDRVEAVRLADGERVEADIVLIALGAVPNTEWLEDSGLELVRGAVRADEYCIAVGTENVAAVGDIALYPHPGSPDPICIEHWSNARDMGAVAAANLLADPDSREVFAAVPTFWSDQYDVKIKSAGLLGIADSYKIVEEDEEKPSLVAEAHKDGELVGAVVFNRNRQIIEYQRKLRDSLLTA